MESVAECAQCQICLESPGVAPLFTCREGHVTCAACVVTMPRSTTSRCATCQAPGIAVSRNRPLEHLLAKLLVECHRCSTSTEFERRRVWGCPACAKDQDPATIIIGQEGMMQQQAPSEFQHSPPMERHYSSICRPIRCIWNVASCAANCAGFLAWACFGMLSCSAGLVALMAVSRRDDGDESE